MTQAATPDSVVGDFDHGEVSYGGIHARLRRDQGRYVVDFASDGGAKRWRATVERTVGSHRVQQYLARDGDVYVRLPLAWDLEIQRFLHLNGAFLTPDPTRDPTRTSIDRADYDRHVTRWNDNCVFCHNVAPNPGLTDGGRFETTTAELGVACEACHGPGEQHADLNRNPLRRYALHLGRWIDPTIANPAQMSAARSNEVCGRCHGQRKTKDIDRVLREGDRFVPGTPLSDHSTPLTRDTTLNGEHDVFAARFWNDGTPRLTAYEYQGLLQSPCAADANFTCGSCHSMHDSDPNLQLRRDRDENTLCTQCHVEWGDEKQASRHSRHAVTSSGNQCRHCHTPNVVYGLIGARISHRIETPDPADNAQRARPDACTQCHVSRTRQWAIDALANWRDANHVVAADSSKHTSNAVSEVATQLFAGDPIERAIAAASLGHDRDDDDNRIHRLAWLLNTLAHDRYPAVRHIARRSLLQLVPANHNATQLLKDYDATEITPDKRAQHVSDIASALGTPRLGPLSVQQVDALRSTARTRDIEIGE